jgi:ferric-dicitrate binding protein FerR (iron transport regulator)
MKVLTCEMKPITCEMSSVTHVRTFISHVTNFISHVTLAVSHVTLAVSHVMLAVTHVIATVTCVIATVTRVITFITHVITFITHVITFITHVITSVTHVITFITHVMTFITRVITFITRVMTFITCVTAGITSVTVAITSVTDVITSVTAAITSAPVALRVLRMRRATHLLSRTKKRPVPRDNRTLLQPLPPSRGKVRRGRVKKNLTVLSFFGQAQSFILRADEIEMKEYRNIEIVSEIKMEEYRDIEIASLVAARLRGDATPEDEERLDAWMAERPENKELYDRLTDGSRLRVRLEEYEGRSIEQLKKRTLAAIARRRARDIGRRIARVAAVVFIPLLAAGGGWWFLARDASSAGDSSLLGRVPGKGEVFLELADGRRVSLARDRAIALEGVPARADSSALSYLPSDAPGESPDYNTLSIARGGEYRLVLSDGTRVWLNSDSRLRYPVAFAGTSREVFLDGEAYFEVTPGGAPFRVHARGAVIEVLGTSFNVMGYADEPLVQATLVSGKVKVGVEGNPAGAVELLPGHQALVDPAGGEITTRAVNASHYTSQQESIFVFDDESLEVIARKLSRWYDAEIELASPALRSASFYGVVPKYANISVFLERLGKVCDMTYAIEGKKIILK